MSERDMAAWAGTAAIPRTELRCLDRLKQPTYATWVRDGMTAILSIRDSRHIARGCRFHATYGRAA